MITSYSVMNYKSIEDMTIEFRPGTSRTKNDHISKDDCLRATAIFGANASGKSNYIKSLKFLKRIVTDPYYTSRDPIYNWNSKNDVTTFQICFNLTKNGIVEEYDYNISIRSVGNRSTNLMKQIFRFEVVDEELIVKDKFGNEKIITKKNSKRIDNSIELIQEMERLKLKLESMQERMDSYEKMMDYHDIETRNLTATIEVLKEEHKDFETKQKQFEVEIKKVIDKLADSGNELDLNKISDPVEKIKILRESINNLEKKHKEMINHKRDRLKEIDTSIWLYGTTLKIGGEDFIRSSLLLDNKMVSKNNKKLSAAQYLDGLSMADDNPFSLTSFGLNGTSPIISSYYDEIDNINKEIEKIDSILQYVRDIKPLLTMAREDYERLIRNERMIISYKDKIDNFEREREELNVEQNKMALGINETMEAIETIRAKLNEAIEATSNTRPLISTKDLTGVKSELSKTEMLRIIDNTYKWFVSTLVILETDDFYLPIYQPNLLDNISKILTSLDVGIYGLGWLKSDYENNELSAYHSYSRVDIIKNQISENDRRKLSDCERNSTYSSSLSSVIIKTGSELNMFTYWKGEETIRKLVSYHNMNRTNPTNITSESDGTRRLIELASILLPSESEKVFIIDELERRLHPLLTRRFVELFLDDQNSNKQLIFATHETKLMTKELFRPDEIWYMYMKEGKSQAVPLDQLISENPKMFNKRTDKMYLDDRSLPGIPHISELPIDADYSVR